MTRVRRFAVAAVALACLLLAASSARAFNITVNYAAGSFLTTNATARAALEAAAADVSALISSTLGATSSTFNGSVNGSTASISTTYNYNHPNTAASTSFGPTTVAANQFILIAGSRNLAGNTLGVGAPGGLAAQASGSYFNLNDFDAALDQAAALAQANLTRGGGPVIGTLAINFEPPNQSVGFTLGYGAAIGAIAFDSILNPDTFWHFNHTTPVPFEATDFYSVALHEILHAIGYSSSQTWDSLASGNNWLGNNVIALRGSGAGVLTNDSDHVAVGITSTALRTGLTQTPVMAASIPNGQRRHLTHLDAAFLRDIGWLISTLPGDADNDGLVTLADLAAVERSLGLLGPADGLLYGDANDDGRVDGDDLLYIERHFSSILAASASVPEPASLTLLLTLTAIGARSMRIRER